MYKVDSRSRAPNSRNPSGGSSGSFIGATSARWNSNAIETRLSPPRGDVRLPQCTTAWFHMNTSPASPGSARMDACSKRHSFSSGVL